MLMGTSLSPMLRASTSDSSIRMPPHRPASTAVEKRPLRVSSLATGAVISVTGLIAFIGLLAPHIARLLTRSSRFSTTVLAGLCGGILLLLSDVLARSIGDSEVPISIITSLLGAPFLFWLMCRKEEPHG